MSTPLHMEGIANIRDLGGMAAAGGREVAPGRLFRSASLHEMTPADRRTLQDLGIRVIADLRSEWERAQQPYEVDFARVVHAPLADDDRALTITRRFMDGTMTSEELENWWELTGIFEAPEDHIQAIRTVFGEVLGLADGEAILYHCRGGKDRTGLITALLLEALGVGRAAMSDDFARSDILNDRHVDTEESRQMKQALEALQLSPAAFKAITSVDPAWLERLLGGIEQRHGSVQTYLAHRVGIGEEGIAALRRRFLMSQSEE